jgi:acyl transferase domain-containing protein
MQDYEAFYNDKILGKAGKLKLDSLAYTLAARRTHMLWRSFAIVADDFSETQDGATGFNPVKPKRSSTGATLAFVFTGQGAQYSGMGWDLVQYHVFANTLRRIDSIYSSFGCKWSIFGKKAMSKHHVPIEAYS